jgi:hypothetical protein
MKMAIPKYLYRTIGGLHAGKLKGIRSECNQNMFLGHALADPKYRELTHFLEYMRQERRDFRSQPPIEKSQVSLKCHVTSQKLSEVHVTLAHSRDGLRRSASRSYD